MAKSKQQGTAEDCAAAWFLVMERALEEGDLERALEARQELLRLGFEVFPMRRKPEPQKGAGDNGDSHNA